MVKEDKMNLKMKLEREDNLIFHSLNRGVKDRV